jgi:hypothetical protein
MIQWCMRNLQRHFIYFNFCIEIFAPITKELGGKIKSRIKEIQSRLFLKILCNHGSPWFQCSLKYNLQICFTFSLFSSSGKRDGDMRSVWQPELFGVTEFVYFILYSFGRKWPRVHTNVTDIGCPVADNSSLCCTDLGLNLHAFSLEEEKNSTLLDVAFSWNNNWTEFRNTGFMVCFLFVPNSRLWGNVNKSRKLRLQVTL